MLGPPQVLPLLRLLSDVHRKGTLPCSSHRSQSRFRCPTQSVHAVRYAKGCAASALPCSRSSVSRGPRASSAQSSQCVSTSVLFFGKCSIDLANSNGQMCMDGAQPDAGESSAGDEQSDVSRSEPDDTPPENVPDGEYTEELKKFVSLIASRRLFEKIRSTTSLSPLFTGTSWREVLPSEHGLHQSYRSVRAQMFLHARIHSGRCPSNRFPINFITLPVRHVRH